MMNLNHILSFRRLAGAGPSIAILPSEAEEGHLVGFGQPMGTKIFTEIAPPQAGFISGMSPAMRTLEGVIQEIAPTDIPVLLVGESGTGKEMFAQRLHELSRHGRLVRITCASLTASTFSTDLGLTTDVQERSNGKREESLFFDEVSEIDLACQRALLHALPEGPGAARAGTIKARVISTTSRDLFEEVRSGRFRSDLYYRLNGVCLRLPPLRERKEDIPLLVEYLLTKHSAQLGRPRPTISPRTIRMLLDHDWPGNIRELENSIKRIVALGNESFLAEELSSAKPRAQQREETRAEIYSLKAASRAASREAERHLILDALARTRWNRKRAAHELQISYKSLLHKLKQIGLMDSGTSES